MTFSEYQDQSASTEKYTESTKLIANTLGMQSELGEFSGPIEKFIRKHGYAPTRDDFDETQLNHLALELGDVLFHLSRAAAAIGFSLEYIAVMNREKLSYRQQTNTIHNHNDH